MIRRFGAHPIRGTKYQLRPGAYAILHRDNQILLTHQADPIPEYQLPGGGIDPGESPISSLHREVLEETGWVIAHVRKLGAYRRFTYMPEYRLWAEKLCHIYTGRPSVQRGAPTEAGHTAVWTDLETASDIVASEGDAAFVLAFLKRQNVPTQQNS